MTGGILKLYASGVGSRLIGLFGRPALESGRIFFMPSDELDQVVDTEVGEAECRVLRPHRPR